MIKLNPFEHALQRHEDITICEKLLHFDIMPGVLHAEMKFIPATIQGILSLLPNRNQHKKKFLRIYENQMNRISSGRISVAYQAYFDILLQIWTLIIPSFPKTVCLFLKFQLKSRMFTCQEQLYWIDVLAYATLRTSFLHLEWNLEVEHRLEYRILTGLIWLLIGKLNDLGNLSKNPLRVCLLFQSKRSYVTSERFF